jgi:endonuclease/exonuclease/phosphatase family metal-dependent hydrolase
MLLATLAALLALAPEQEAPLEFTALTWNIWHGGREDGEEVGPRKVVEVLRASGADLVALQETYGSGERIAAELGFHFAPRGTNVSLLSRHPIVADLSVFEEFKCVGALVELSRKRRVAFFSVWLPYDGEIWEPGTRAGKDAAALQAACASSARDLAKLLDELEARLAREGLADVPVIVAGDFNSMSHLDYGEVARDQYGTVVDWATSHVLLGAGFSDVYRELVPEIRRAVDRTWTPRFPEQEQDRIDFVYARGAGLEPLATRVIADHPEGFPSDHAAVLARFRLAPPPPPPDELALRAVTYNIKHGRGMDERVDLARTAATLAALAPDLVGLQEVDQGVRRSGGVNEAAELGRRLGLHAAFGAFMPHDGGHYGMAILSRYPLRDVRSLRLPDGNEPRIALLAEVRLPTGEPLTVVNVHLDWVDDDSFRFAQASALAEYLRTLPTPWLLLGDFNDGPDSRTFAQFRALAAEAAKPADARATFPSSAPEKEIDFLFTAPSARWQASSVRVVSEPLASDHRPVLAELRLRRTR